MNARPKFDFDPSSSRIRTLCAVAAVAATLCTLDFIDALAHGYGNADPVLAKSAVIVMAARR
jgi:hypothetical protein